MAINRLRDLVDIIRPYNTISGVLVFNIGYFIFSPVHTFSANYFIAAVIIILSFSWATIQNDIADLKIDKINTPDKALADGRLSLSEVLNFSSLIFIWLLILSLYNFPYHLFFVISLLGLSWLYNKPPFLFSRRPLASPIILALCYSTVPLIYGYYLGSGLTSNLNLLELIISWFLIRYSIAILKDYKDLQGDRIHNKRTFCLSFGFKNTAISSAICFTLGSAGFIWLLLANHQFVWLYFLPLLFLFRNLYLRLKLFKSADDKKLNNIFLKIFFGQNQFDLVFLLCLIFGN